MDRGDESKRTKLRVNGKFFPSNTKIGVPQQFRGWQKTTLTQVDEESPWRCVEDRVDVSVVTSFENDEVGRCLIFLQPPKAGGGDVAMGSDPVAFNATFHIGELLDEAHVSTLDKHQRRIVKGGLRQEQVRRQAETHCVRDPGDAEGHEPEHPMMVVAAAKMAARARETPGVVVVDVGPACRSRDISSARRDMIDVFEKSKPSLVVSYVDSEEDAAGELASAVDDAMDAFAEAGASTANFRRQWPQRPSEKKTHITQVHMRGNITCEGNTPSVLQVISTWCDSGPRHHAPKSLEDIGTAQFWDMMRVAHVEAERDWLARVCYGSVYAEEYVCEVATSPLDAPDDNDKSNDNGNTGGVDRDSPMERPDEDSSQEDRAEHSETPRVRLPHDIEDAKEREEALLEMVPLPGVPGHEARRREKWLKLPRRARAAIRKMHQEWGHINRTVLMRILRQAKAPKEYVDAAAEFLCHECQNSAPKAQTSKVGPPRPYEFNVCVGVDVLYLHDYAGQEHMFFNIVDQGTNFQIVSYLGIGPGTPTSKLCADVFMQAWVSWAGWPRDVVSDRGLHNRGYFARMLGAHGICPRNIGLESPEQLGRVERHGGLWKQVAKRTISSQELSGADDMRMLASCTNAIMNDNVRKGGFAPSQWVLGRFPRSPGDQFTEEEFADLGCVSEKVDAQSAFYRMTQIRMASKRSFTHADCSHRVASIMLRKAAPTPGDYKVGDLICFRREQNAKTPDQRWSTPTRIIGFDGPKVVWGLNETVPVCLAIDKIRPATPAEALAHLYLHGHRTKDDFIVCPDEEQMKYVNVAHPPGLLTRHDEGQIARSSDAVLRPVSSSRPHGDPEPTGALRTDLMPVVPTARTDTDGSDGGSVKDASPRMGEATDVVSSVLVDDEAEQTLRRRTLPAEVLPSMKRSRMEADSIAASEPMQARHRSRTRERESEGAEDRTAFLAERVTISTEVRGNRRKQMAGKTLCYEKADPLMRAGLDASREKEWKKWQDFGAGVVVSGTTLADLLAEGHKSIPTQWVETDKNAHKAGTPDYKPEYKSRLVACGHLEDRRGIRSDSPTVDLEVLNLIASFAACTRTRLHGADLSNAYFQGEKMDRLLLLRPPRGGLPGMRDGDYMIAANVPIYGTGDAGRKFYKGFRAQALRAGLRECKLARSAYVFVVDGKIKVFMGAHVDDLLWAAVEGFEYVMDALLKNFEVKEIHTGTLRFCGREYKQSEDGSVLITCTSNTNSILPINFQSIGRTPESAATAGEISQLRSVVGSLSWIARQCRLDFSYHCSKLQSITPVAQVKHLHAANVLLKDLKATADLGLFYQAGAFDFHDALMLTMSDASWASDDKIVNNEVYTKRSQHGRITALSSQHMWDGDIGPLHFISWKSGLIKRVCRSTFRAETHGMIYATEASDKVRAILADLRGQLEDIKAPATWESRSAELTKNVWMTDCQSLHDYLVSTVANGSEDKRLEIDLESLRESLWEWPDGRPKDAITDGQTDRPRWIDTSTMLCDPLTKSGNAAFYTRLRTAMSTGIIDLTPTPESLLRKMQQQKLRMKRVDAPD